MNTRSNNYILIKKISLMYQTCNYILESIFFGFEILVFLLTKLLLLFLLIKPTMYF